MSIAPRMDRLIRCVCGNDPETREWRMDYHERTSHSPASIATPIAAVLLSAASTILHGGSRTTSNDTTAQTLESLRQRQRQRQRQSSVACGSEAASRVLHQRAKPPRHTPAEQQLSVPGRIPPDPPGIVFSYTPMTFFTNLVHLQHKFRSAAAFLCRHDFSRA